MSTVLCFLKSNAFYFLPFVTVGRLRYFSAIYRKLSENRHANIKMAEKERKTLDTLPERCTITMHHEISARGLLVPAGDGSAQLSDTLSPTRQ